VQQLFPLQLCKVCVVGGVVIGQSMQKMRHRLDYLDATQRMQVRGLPFLTARTCAGLTQLQAAAMVGVDQPRWSRFETQKNVYTIRELAVLRDMSGLTWDQYGAILDEAAKPKE